MKMRIFATAATALLVAACGSTRTTSTSAPPAPAQAYAPQPPQPVQSQPSPDVRDAQQRLHALGYYNGPIDGVWGPDTRAAVQEFQRSRNLPLTAELDDSTRRAMRNTAAAAPVTLNDPTNVRTVQNRLRQLNFYNGPANGVWGRDTQAAVERFQQARGLPVGQVNQATISAMGLDPTQFQQRNVASQAGTPLDPTVVRSVQNRLRQHGYYSGRADGVWGARTQASLERFQKSRGLEPTGDLNPMTASALGLDPNNLSLSAVPNR